MYWATTSLPVPDSPEISTAESTTATVAAVDQGRAHGGALSDDGGALYRRRSPQAADGGDGLRLGGLVVELVQPVQGADYRQNVPDFAGIRRKSGWK